MGAVENGGALGAIYRAIGQRRGSSTVWEVDGTAKSGTVAREAEGGSGWHLEVEDDRRKLGRWVECAVGPNYRLGL
jgi:hypothetical protein